MTILPIILCTSRALRENAKPCSKPYSQYKALADNMIETMYKAPGVGLAAPQIGVGLRLFVYDSGSGPVVAINPEIISRSIEKVDYEEGCLSVPEINAVVSRPSTVRFRAFGLDGYRFEKNAEGLEARVVQHEYDHLDGILFIDLVVESEKKTIELKLKKLGKIARL